MWLEPNQKPLCADESPCITENGFSDRGHCSEGATCEYFPYCGREVEQDVSVPDDGLERPSSNTYHRHCICDEDDYRDHIQAVSKGFQNMQDYCISEQGAFCATNVTFPASNGQEKNPGNCGNACHCENSACPPVPISCSDPKCAGNSEVGRCEIGLGSSLGLVLVQREIVKQ